MTSFSYDSLQRAIYQLLATDPDMALTVTGVFDRVPQGQPYPYVAIGDFTASDWSTKTTSGIEYMVTIDTWSREGGRKESAAIFEHIYRLLHDVNLAVEKNVVNLIRFHSSVIGLMNDGCTYHGIMRFRVLIET